MIFDQVTGAVAAYESATGEKPTRIYFGTHQRLEWERHVETHHTEDLSKNEVLGVRILRVSEPNHFYVAGDIA